MIEILFRAFCKKDNKYRRVASIDFINKTVLVVPLETDEGYDFFKIDDNTFFMYEQLSFDDVVLEQFTGLYDKNGTKIFDGDILQLDLNNEGLKTAQVNYRYGCFVFDTPKESYTIWESEVLENHIEVIGNIHEEETK